MSLYATSPESLWSSPAFVRFMTYSIVAHGAAMVLLVYGELFRFRTDMLPEPVMIDLVAMAEPGEPEPPPPEPAPVVPPEPPPPEPPAPEPAPPEQVVEEALVVPDVPPEKPRPPKPPKPPKPPEQKPKPKPQDVADLMKDLRKDVEKRTPAPAKPRGAGGGTVDPELAGYLRTVKACMETNWVGAQRFLRRRDLEVLLLIELDTTGQVESVEVSRSSGEDQLDDTAERAVLKCSPSLPPPPSGRSQVEIAFSPGGIQ